VEMTSYRPGTPSWVDELTPDPAASEGFYTGLFGWQVEDQGPEAGGYRMCRLSGKPVAGLSPLYQPGMPPAWTTYVTVEDADTTAKIVEESGGQVLIEPMDVLDVGRMAMFTEPTGAAFAVWQPKLHQGAGLVNEPGTLCWTELTTRNPDDTVDFHRAVFGWEAKREQMGDVGYTTWYLGDRPIGGLMAMDDRWPSDVPSHWMVYFAVDDADRSAARAAELGGAIVVPPADLPVGRFAALTDPHGAAFSIIKMTS
jgi:predicted enzyme related to lactoylglutathione lyase